MVNKLGALARIVASKIRDQKLFTNANATVQQKLNTVQSTVQGKYDTIVKQINNEITMFQDPKAVGLQPTPMPRKLVKWWQWYQELTGLHVVETARAQVIAAQERVFKCQDERRLLNKQVAQLNDKLKEIYAELIQIKRDDPKYVQLIMIENKSLQDHAKVSGELVLLEKDERDYFTQLATAIKEYHDSQTMYAQKFRYLSILASAMIAIMSLIGSMIYNNKRITDMRNMIAMAEKNNEAALTSNLSSLQSNLDTKLTEIAQQILSLNVAKTIPSLKEENKVNSESSVERVYFTRSEVPLSYAVVTLTLVGGIGIVIAKLLHG